MEPQLTAITEVFDESGSPEPPPFVIDPQDHVRTLLDMRTGGQLMQSPNIDDAVAGVASVVMQILQEMPGVICDIEVEHMIEGVPHDLFELRVHNKRKAAN